jgi:hypothetical protein
MSMTEVKTILKQIQKRLQLTKLISKTFIMKKFITKSFDATASVHIEPGYVTKQMEDFRKSLLNRLHRCQFPGCRGEGSTTGRFSHRTIKRCPLQADHLRRVEEKHKENIAYKLQESEKKVCFR